MKILFCGIDFNRKDLLNALAPVKNKAQCFFLENFQKLNTGNSHLSSIGRQIYWADYNDAFDLLDQVKPDKVVFLLIDNYYHFALLKTAKLRKIPVIYLDHGIRYEEENENLKQLEDSRRLTWAAKLKKTYPGVCLSFLKNLFFRNTLQKLSRADRKLMAKMFFKRGRITHSEFMKQMGYMFVPDEFIMYSPATFRFHKKIFRLDENKTATTRVQFIGIPSIDRFSNCHFVPDSKRKVLLFIDQPLYEQNLLGWTLPLKRKFFDDLLCIVKAHDFKLYIKPHPWNSSENYLMLNSESDVIIINGDLDKEFIENNVLFVGSFNSTLVLPFCAMDQVITFCMENHPIAILPAISEGITKYKVAAKIRSTDELKAMFSNRENILISKRENIPLFIKDVLYLFDGRSGERMVNVLTA
ncbi:MAG: hypothetical protein IT214_11225 [Chitinophagaceae bacterium]|jgi:hypothetical protein|nr:hypothetical protein [Chitinophagaceae bacterium]OQY95710.1 MAG: hypothetical protein B6D37_04450 [Sphingobacteriales bacterium UTBCD1]